MFAVKELRLNAFRPAKVLKGREIFQKFGVCPGKTYSGDQIIPVAMSKIDAVKMADAIDRNSVAAEAAEAAARTAPSEPAPTSEPEPKSE